MMLRASGLGRPCRSCRRWAVAGLKVSSSPHHVAWAGARDALGNVLAAPRHLAEHRFKVQHACAPEQLPISRDDGRCDRCPACGSLGAAVGPTGSGAPIQGVPACMRTRVAAGPTGSRASICAIVCDWAGKLRRTRQGVGFQRPLSGCLVSSTARHGTTA